MDENDIFWFNPEPVEVAGEEDGEIFWFEEEPVEEASVEGSLSGKEAGGSGEESEEAASLYDQEPVEETDTEGALIDKGIACASAWAVRRGDFMV